MISDHDRRDSRIPGFDRRALERLAVGAPSPGRARRKRAVGLRFGALRHQPAIYARPSPARPSLLDFAPPPLRTLSTPVAPHPLASPTPGPASPAHPARERLILIVVERALRGSAEAADAVLEAANELAGRYDLITLDLDVDRPSVGSRLGPGGREGLADILLFGASLRHVATADATSGLRVLPVGLFPNPDDLYAHPHWDRLLREAGRSGLTLLVHVPQEGEGLEALARRADAVILVGRPVAEAELRRLIPADVRVMELITPRPAPFAPVAPPEMGHLERARAAIAAAFGTLTSPARPPAPSPPAPPATSEPASPPRVSQSPSRDVAVPSEPPAAHADASGAPPYPPALEEPAALGKVLEAPPVVDEWAAAEPVVLEGPAAPEALVAEEWAPEAPPLETPAGPGRIDRPTPALDAGVDVPVAAEAAPSVERPPEEPPRPAPGPRVAPKARPAEPAHTAASFAATLAGWLKAEEKRLEAGGEEASEATPESGGEADPRNILRALDDAELHATAVEEWQPLPIELERDRLASAISDPPRPRELSSDLLANAPAADELIERVIARKPRVGPAPAKYIVPRVSERVEKLFRVLAVLILAYWTYYIVWRWTATLNLDALWFSVPLVLAETWGLLTALFLVHTAWRLNHRTPTPAPPGLSVDVFITTYDEPLEIIRRTAISARAINYPHQTYVLDDGRRDEVKSMAEELGVGYIRREDNEHAKAGNLNNALRYTSGDFILQLDADHAPLPQMLDQVLGFFTDDRVAFVQTPQDFYNTDAFTTDLNETAHRLWEEQRLFFAVIQPGKDRTNSAFFCGSCAVIRRDALNEIGGFSTESITEDIETSLLIHSRGWKSVYYGESLAYGLAAGSADAFHTQHRRWARGAMQVIRRFNPLRYPGLSFSQRLGYFYSLTAYVIGLQKLIFYAAPIVFFLTGVLPIDSLNRDFLLRFVPYLVLTIALAEMLARGLGFTWLVERYQMAKFWTYTRALTTYFSTGRLRFLVTPKGRATTTVGTYLPQLILMTITVVAVNWATVAYRFGWVDYSAPGWASLAFLVNFLWAALNFVLAAYVVRLSIRMQQQRQDHRFADRFPIHVRRRGARGRLGERELALTEDLNASGLRFRSVHRFDAGEDLKITLPLSTGEASVNAIVVHVRHDPESDVQIFMHGVEFRDVPFDVRDAIELHCAHHAVPIDQMRYHTDKGVIARASDWVRNARGEPRRRVRLPTWVQIGSTDTADAREEVAFLEEISRGGARLIMDQPVAPGTPMSFVVPGTELRGDGHSVFSRALETPVGVRFAVGMRREMGHDHDTRPDRIMRIPRLWRATGVATSLMLALGAISSTADAQRFETAIYGTGEVDTEDLSLFLLGASIQPAGLGWKPVVSLLGYQLNYPVGASTQSVTAINPAAGIRYQWPVGAVQAQAGYLFLSGDTAGAFGIPGGGEDGVTGSVMGDYWGTGPRTAQAIATYNFSDQYFWSRARAAQQLLTIGQSPVRFGGELVLQGADVFNAEEDVIGAPEAYRAMQIGGLAEYQLNPSFKLTGVVGGKSDNIADNPDFFPYFKVEFVLVP